MLSFEFAASISIRIDAQSISGNPITIRGATRESQFVYVHTPNSDKTPSTEQFRITEMPLWLTAQDEQGSGVSGQCYVRLSLVFNGDVLYQFASGYVYGQYGISWPMATLKESTPTFGQRKLITVDGDGVGLEHTVTVPANQMWKILSLRYTLVTAATVGSRRTHVTFGYDTTVLYDVLSSVDQIISQTRKISCTQIAGAGTYADDNDIVIPLPVDLILPSGSKIKTSTTNLAAGDNYTECLVNAEVFLSP